MFVNAAFLVVVLPDSNSASVKPWRRDAPEAVATAETAPEVKSGAEARAPLATDNGAAAARGGPRLGAGRSHLAKVGWYKYVRT